MLCKSALAFAVASLALGGAAFAEEPSAAKSPPTVSVVGTASEDVRPDIVIVTFVVSDERPSATDAADENARRSRTLVDGLAGAGIEEKDIATLGLGLTQTWSDERDAKTGQIVKRTPSGYRASNTLSVRLRRVPRSVTP